MTYALCDDFYHFFFLHPNDNEEKNCEYKVKGTALLVFVSSSIPIVSRNDFESAVCYDLSSRRNRVDGTLRKQ